MAAAVVVEKLRQDVLPSSTFSLQQNGGDFALRYAPRELKNLLHSRRCRHDLETAQQDSLIVQGAVQGLPGIRSGMFLGWLPGRFLNRFLNIFGGAAKHQNGSRDRPAVITYGSDTAANGPLLASARNQHSVAGQLA